MIDNRRLNMARLIIVFILFFIFSTQTFAFEPELDQQGMIYFDLSFDASLIKKTQHQFGFRMDRTLRSPVKTITMSQLNAMPAVFNIAYDSNGLKSLKINGINYAYQETVVRGAESGGEGETAVETEPEPVVEAEAPKKKINIPFGVVIGVLIGTFAIAS